MKAHPLFANARCFLAALVLGAICYHPPDARATQFAGLWRSGSDANYVNYGLDEPTLLNLATQYHTNGLRMVNLRTYLSNGARVWAAIWRGGGAAGEYYSLDLTWSQFTDLYAQRHTNNLRLIDIETYEDKGVRKWAGIWHSGSDAEYLDAGLTVDQLNATDAVHISQNARLVDVETYLEGGVRKWAGLWRSGTDASQFSSDLTLAGFNFINAIKHAQGLELIDVESYPDSLGAQQWAGVWRTTNNPTQADVTMDFEKLNAEISEQFASGRRMFCLSVYDVQCAPACMDTVVAPSAYIYGITRTATHCNQVPGTCSAPPNGSVVSYRWPVDTDPGGNLVRLSAVNVPDQFLTLPFADPQVNHSGIWRYSSGDWHHAADYSRPDTETFRARAAAPGTVIFKGWDVWSGNTVILSHDINGQKDNYRTIYMHLRNGASNDCWNAWNLTVPWFGTRPDLYNDYTNYVALLNYSGCTQNPATRNLNTNYWGLEADKIHVSVGQKIARGAWLASAGETGPGGNRHLPLNTHLHIFFCHRDPVDNNWYFFDPYGIYATPDCYPAGVTDYLSTDCVRYPIAWQGGHPQYPPPVVDYEKVYLGRLGEGLKFSWEDAAAQLEYTLNVNGRWAPISTTSNLYYVPFGPNPTYYRLQK